LRSVLDHSFINDESVAEALPDCGPSRFILFTTTNTIIITSCYLVPAGCPFTRSALDALILAPAVDPSSAPLALSLLFPTNK
jgi:hypothetical protein